MCRRASVTTRLRASVPAKLSVESCAVTNRILSRMTTMPLGTSMRDAAATEPPAPHGRDVKERAHHRIGAQSARWGGGSSVAACGEPRRSSARSSREAAALHGPQRPPRSLRRGGRVAVHSVAASVGVVRSQMSCGGAGDVCWWAQRVDGGERVLGLGRMAAPTACAARLAQGGSIVRVRPKRRGGGAARRRAWPWRRAP